MSSLAEHLYQEEIYQFQYPVVVVVSEPWHKILEAEKALLAKILGSVRVNIDSVLIVTQPEVSAETVASFNSGKVLIFGSTGLRLKPYEISNVNEISVVKADALNDLNDVGKKNLWTALKQMFPH